MEEEDASEASDEEDTLLTPELREWRTHVSDCRHVDDMHALISQLSKALAWDKSIMKVTCQICKRDDNESELLLCDGCDLGFHSYCFRPHMPPVPDADDWFCFVCVALVTRTRRCFICGQMGAGRLRDGSDSLGPQLLTCSNCTRSMHLECCLPIDATSCDALAAAQTLASTRITRSWLCRHCSEAAQLEKDMQQQRSSTERSSRGGGRRGGRGDSYSSSNGPSARRQQAKAESEAPARSKSPSSTSSEASDEKSAAHQRQRDSARERNSSTATGEPKPARKRRGGKKAEGTQHKKARQTDTTPTPLAADDDSVHSSLLPSDGPVQQSEKSGRKRVIKRKSTSTESSEAVADPELQSTASSEDMTKPLASGTAKRSSPKPKKAKRETSDDGEKNKRTENGPQQNDAALVSNSNSTSASTTPYRPLKIKLKKASAPLANSVSGASDVNTGSSSNSDPLASHNSASRSPPHTKPLLIDPNPNLNSLAVGNSTSTANTHFHQSPDGVRTPVHSAGAVVAPAAGTGLATDMSPCWTLLGEFEQHQLSGPFSKPVDARKFPTYRVVISHPMDISTLRAKLSKNWYVNTLCI